MLSPSGRYEIGTRYHFGEINEMPWESPGESVEPGLPELAHALQTRKEALASEYLALSLTVAVLRQIEARIEVLEAKLSQREAIGEQR